MEKAALGTDVPLNGNVFKCAQISARVFAIDIEKVGHHGKTQYHPRANISALPNPVVGVEEWRISSLLVNTLTLGSQGDELPSSAPYEGWAQHRSIFPLVRTSALKLEHVCRQGICKGILRAVVLSGHYTAPTFLALSDR